LVDGNGKIYVTFAVPINLGRGVYLTSSEDGGLTWSDPILAFDGEAAGWAMVDGPQLAESAEGELHLIWYRYSPPDGPGPLGLFYSQSGDGGLSWATPEALVEKPIRWSQVSSKRDNLVHRIWKEETSGSLTIWHDLSLDNGVTWSRSSPVTVFGSLDSLASLASDNAGQLHLVHLVNRGAGNHTMQHWIWGAEGWLTEQSLDFSQSVTSRITELSSIVTNQGDLTVVLNGIDLNTDTGKQEDSLLFTRREIEQPEGGSIGPVISTPESSLTPTLAPTETSTPTPVATESPTSVTPQGTLGVRETENFEEEPDGLTSGSSMWWYAGGLAVFLAVVLVVVYTRKGPRTR
jgi:hypothetical protein